MAYAEKTRVPVEQSRTEIERLLTKYKATSVAVYSSIDQSAIAFTVAEHVRPRIASAYSEGKMQPLLPAPNGSNRP